jgi:hypothetical protein
MLRDADENVRKVAKENGMAQAHPRPGVERWQHSDGSYIELIFRRRRPVIGWSHDGFDYPLGRLPYNNRLG